MDYALRDFVIKFIPVTVDFFCVLDLENKQWDKSMMGPLPQPRKSHAAVNMENIGTYLIGGPGQQMTSEFMAQGATRWTPGPDIPVDMEYPCAVSISSLNFLIIDRTDIREYQVDILDPTSKSGWQNATKWPQKSF